MLDKGRIGSLDSRVHLNSRNFDWSPMDHKSIHTSDGSFGILSIFVLNKTVSLTFIGKKVSVDIDEFDYSKWRK
jgi:hypothetical protein